MPIHDWKSVPAGIFHDFHQDWTICLKHALNGGILPPGYYALVEQESVGRHPDVLTFEVARPATAGDGNGSTHISANGGVFTLAEAPPRVGITATVESDAFTRNSNRVLLFDDADEVVSVIEIVSPGNKSSRYRFDSFVEKALALLRSGIHLLMVDLFPPTSRDPHGMHAAIWSRMTEYDFRPPADKPLTVASYSSGVVQRAFVEPVAVGTALPQMPLFLDPERYVLLPLETSYQTTFHAMPERWRGRLSL
ncbi:MAG: DUF4058 family protein [Candidatus Saccharimonadales bacterium]